MNGVLVIDKHKGVTSHDVVDIVRRVLRTRRIGHAGTLDPMATGVLIIAVGSATKLVRFLKTDPKEYRAEMLFGIETDTDDVTGKIRSEADASGLNESQVNEAIRAFRGKIAQVPPAISAIKVKGVPLYKMARREVEIAPEARQVDIFELELTGFEAGKRALAGLRVVCSAGTYIRSLARDIGRAVGTGGTLSQLTRVRSGDFSLDQAVKSDELDGIDAVLSRLLPIENVLGHLAAIKVREAYRKGVMNGSPVTAGSVVEAGPATEGDIVKVLDESDKLLAIAKALIDTNKIGSLEPDEVVARTVRVLTRDESN